MKKSLNSCSKNMTPSYVKGESTTTQGSVNTAVRDPILLSDRSLEIALRVERNRNQVDFYFSIQKDITPAMRKIVAEWMLEVCAEEKCQEEVVLLALSFLDRFLSTKSVRKTHLQILAAACLLLASKLREPSCRALSVDLLVIYTDNSIFKDDLIKWELCVISRLGWDLSSVTPLDFVEHLIIRLPKIKENVRDVSMEKVRRHAQAFISLAAKEHTFTTYSSSTIAASSIATSMHGLKWNVRSGHNLNFLLSHLTNITKAPQAQLKECMLHMEDIFNEHSRNMRHFCLDIQQSQSSAIYLQGHFHVQHPEYIQEHGATPFSQMSVVSLPLSGTSDSLKQHKHHSFKSVLPCRIKACSMHKHASTEIDKHTI
ncbi:G1/S-specific cyclin-D2 isoform X3 [Drosophila ananassae]|uniref:G1/S-specific cyclin-D2 isoform X3 n=1 Tax=Drosophila ananassae TaxID=7217 RepID=UPI0013A5EDA4|nr:G1/S-specific cyclin-D2 isoform X3 [Drosophila ananassae]